MALCIPICLLFLMLLYDNPEATDPPPPNPSVCCCNSGCATAALVLRWEEEVVGLGLLPTPHLWALLMGW